MICLDSCCSYLYLIFHCFSLLYPLVSSYRYSNYMGNLILGIFGWHSLPGARCKSWMADLHSLSVLAHRCTVFFL
ncbi:hypothetical protein BDV41DRAFT_86109 [Aspergillus transmontanensis]|uniref:Uncharacterized protein n=1 Tax=Aspergillus transmontanensis TaxID=1034304 RepID=A0A5N6VES3_9EURO|nr:hypothetical protein BDV41DRAFT_86109 [Aspergillus transmontanensis]